MCAPSEHVGTIDGVRIAELILIVVQTFLVFWTIRIAQSTLKQAADAAADGDRDRLARRLSDAADVIGEFWNVIVGTIDVTRARRLQVKLRALLIGAATRDELPAAFELADEPIPD